MAKNEQAAVETIETTMHTHRLSGEGFDSVRSNTYHVCACGTRHPVYDYGRWPTHEQHVAAEIAKSLGVEGLLVA